MPDSNDNRLKKLREDIIADVKEVQKFLALTELKFEDVKTSGVEYAEPMETWFQSAAAKMLDAKTREEFDTYHDSFNEGLRLLRHSIAVQQEKDKRATHSALFFLTEITAAAEVNFYENHKISYENLIHPTYNLVHKAKPEDKDFLSECNKELFRLLRETDINEFNKNKAALYKKLSSHEDYISPPTYKLFRKIGELEKHLDELGNTHRKELERGTSHWKRFKDFGWMSAGLAMLTGGLVFSIVAPALLVPAIAFGSALLIYSTADLSKEAREVAKDIKAAKTKQLAWSKQEKAVRGLTLTASGVGLALAIASAFIIIPVLAVPPVVAVVLGAVGLGITLGMTAGSIAKHARAWRAARKAKREAAALKTNFWENVPAQPKPVPIPEESDELQADEDEAPAPSSDSKIISRSLEARGQTVSLEILEKIKSVQLDAADGNNEPQIEKILRSEAPLIKAADPHAEQDDDEGENEGEMPAPARP